jgi:hypothetical protein
MQVQAQVEVLVVVQMMVKIHPQAHLQMMKMQLQHHQLLMFHLWMNLKKILVEN